MLDHIDKGIIRLLQRNARTPNTEMARQLEISETTVRNRVTRLLEEELIEIVAIVNPKAANHQLSAIVMIRPRVADLDHVVLAIKQRPEVRYLGVLFGAYPILVEAFFSDHQHLLEFQTDVLGSMPGVESVEVSIVGKVEKYTYEWEI
jgi:Lrp/AsnC family transcriptional regulator, regulator for asnA, asnC and gidA